MQRNWAWVEEETYFDDWTTGGERAKQLGIDTNAVDFALPQIWVNHFVQTTEFNPVGHFVWSYEREKGANGGMPVALTEEADKALDLYNRLTHCYWGVDYKVTVGAF